MSPRRLLSLFAIAPMFLGLNASAVPPGIGGEYTAIVNGATFDTSGKVRVVLTRSGVGSVSLTVGDEPPCVVLVGFDPGDGSLFPRGGDPDMSVHLILIPGPDGAFVLKGDVGDDGEIYPIEATQAPTTSGPATGAHTFVLGTKSTAADVGTGFARVARNGRVTGVVHVGQHKPVSFGGRLNADHKLPLAVRFGKSESSFTGDVSFADFGTGGTATLHDDDVSTPVYSWRANYHPRLRPLEGTAGSYGLVAKLNDSPAGTATQLNSGAIIRATFQGQPATFRLNRATGVFTGGTKAHTLRGVVLQDTDILAGLCDGTGEFNIVSNGPANSSTSSASAGLSKTGGGTLILTGSNTYTSATTINATTSSINATAGSLRLSAGASDMPVSSAGTVTTSIVNSGSLNLNPGGQDAFVIYTNPSLVENSVSSASITIGRGALEGQTLILYPPHLTLANPSSVLSIPDGLSLVSIGSTTIYTGAGFQFEVTRPDPAVAAQWSSINGIVGGTVISAADGSLTLVRAPIVVAPTGPVTTSEPAAPATP